MPHARQLVTALATAAVSAPPAPASAPRARYLGRDAAMLRAALESTGTSERALAERLRLSRARVQQWLAGDAALSVERIESVHAESPTAGRELARLACDRLMLLLEAPRPSQADAGRCVLACTAELGDVARVFAAALADGSVSDVERAVLRREVRELADAVDALRRAVG